MMGNGPLGLIAVQGSKPVTALPLTGLWQGSYTGSPWVGTASAGSSATQNLTEATNPPSSGTSVKVNGFAPAVFNGTNQSLSNPNLTSSLITTTSYFAWALAYVESIATGNPNAYDNDAVFEDGAGVFGIALTNVGGVGASQAQFYHYDGTNTSFTSPLSILIPTQQYVLMAMWFDGTLLHAQVNGGAVQSKAWGPLNTFAQSANLHVGCNYNGVHCFNGRILQVGFSDTQQSSWADTIRRYDNAVYQLNL